MKKFLSLPLATAAFAFVISGIGCDQGSKVTASNTQSVEDRSSSKILRPDTLVGIEAIQPGNFYCIAKRIDIDTNREYFGSGKTELEACNKARTVCNDLTGGGDGNGICITSVAYDNVITGSGMISEGTNERYICFATEYLMTAEGLARKWMGAGKTVLEAQENAIKLCKFRDGGANCQKFASCTDTSNANINPVP